MRLNKFRIERAGLSDLGVLHKLEVECFKKNAYSKTSLGLLLTDWRAASFKAIMNERIVGFIIGRVERIRGKRAGRIYTLNVEPKCRRRGIGEALMKRLEEEFSKRGCEEIFLEVAVNNVPAITLYKKLGYEVVEKLRNYYGPGKDAYRAKKIVKSSELESESIIKGS